MWNWFLETSIPCEGIKGFRIVVVIYCVWGKDAPIGQHISNTQTIWQLSAGDEKSIPVQEIFNNLWVGIGCCTGPPGYICSQNLWEQKNTVFALIINILVEHGHRFHSWFLLSSRNLFLPRNLSKNIGSVVWSIREVRWFSFTVLFPVWIEIHIKTSDIEPFCNLLTDVNIKGTQEWEFFWLRFWNLRYFFVSYVQILRFYKKKLLIGPLLGEIRFFRVVLGLRRMRKNFELGKKFFFFFFNYGP